MKLILNCAKWRPLGDPMSEPPINDGRPRALFTHTMVGNLRGTENMFRKNGYGGTESQFGIGGPADGPALDGEIWQWQRLDRQADAQLGGNHLFTSVETSDGGNPDNPWSPKQLEALVILHLEWVHETGRPAREMDHPDDVGFGYHSLFPKYNAYKKTCPGKVRIEQLRREVWPEVALRLRGTDVEPKPKPPVSGVEATVVPKFPLPEGGYFGERDGKGGGISGFDMPGGHPGIHRIQRQLKARGWKIEVDGRFGKQTGDVVEAFQKEKKLGVDRRVGLQTWNAAWTAKIT